MKVVIGLLMVATIAGAKPPCKGGADVCQTSGYLCITVELAAADIARRERETAEHRAALVLIESTCDADKSLLRREASAERDTFDRKFEAVTFELGATESALAASQSREGASTWEVIGWTAGGVAVGAIVGALAVWFGR